MKMMSYDIVFNLLKDPLRYLYLIVACKKKDTE